jgi:hypothetical protein
MALEIDAYGFIKVQYNGPRPKDAKGKEIAHVKWGYHFEPRNDYIKELPAAQANRLKQRWPNLYDFPRPEDAEATATIERLAEQVEKLAKEVAELKKKKAGRPAKEDKEE